MEWIFRHPEEVGGRFYPCRHQIGLFLWWSCGRAKETIMGNYAVFLRNILEKLLYVFNILQVKRRRRVNSDVFKVFSHIKLNGEQPVGAMFVLPSGLSTFTSSALKWVVQEVIVSHLYIWQLLLSTGHWVRRCFAPYGRLTLRLPTMHVRIIAWEYWDRTQTLSYMTGVLMTMLFIVFFPWI